MRCCSFPLSLSLFIKNSLFYFTLFVASIKSFPIIRILQISDFSFFLRSFPTSMLRFYLFLCTLVLFIRFSLPSFFSFPIFLSFLPFIHYLSFHCYRPIVAFLSLLFPLSLTLPYCHFPLLSLSSF